MRTARHSKQRGAASVEAAISMLIIIPAFMYALFLDDLLRYAADLQESVVSTPWDFTGQNYNQPGSRGLGTYGSKDPKWKGGETLTQHHARLMYCDHESSGDTYSATADKDCDEEDHHKGKALSGHVCWLNEGAHQITCESVQSNVGLLGANLYQGYMSKFARAGGMYECHGQEIVENYLLPKNFLQEFAGKDNQLTKENWNNNGPKIHQNAQDGKAATAYYLAEQRFALVTDSWAVNEVPDASGEQEKELDLAVAPGTKSGPLYDRVDHVYSGNLLYTPFQLATTAFLTQASNKLLSPAIILSRPDNPAEPSVSLTKVGTSPPQQKIEQDNKSPNYYSTPWRDWASDPYQKTHAKRGKYYMGCKTAQKTKC